MPNIIHNLAVLLSKADNSPVAEGATLRVTVGGYDVRLLSSLPDADGLVTVQSFPQRVTPEDVGLRFRPASVIMELTEAEAAPVIEFYQQQVALLGTPPPEVPPDFPQAPPE